MDITISEITKPNEKWQKMKNVYDACVLANIPTPYEVDEFFDNEPPSNIGIKKEMKIEKQENSQDMTDVYLVDLSKVSKDVTHIEITAYYD